MPLSSPRSKLWQILLPACCLLPPERTIFCDQALPLCIDDQQRWANTGCALPVNLYLINCLGGNSLLAQYASRFPPDSTALRPCNHSHCQQSPSAPTRSCQGCTWTENVSKLSGSLPSCSPTPLAPPFPSHPRPCPPPMSPGITVSPSPPCQANEVMKLSN